MSTNIPEQHGELKNISFSRMMSSFRWRKLITQLFVLRHNINQILQMGCSIQKSQKPFPTSSRSMMDISVEPEESVIIPNRFELKTKDNMTSRQQPSKPDSQVQRESRSILDTSMIKMKKSTNSSALTMSASRKTAAKQKKVTFDMSQNRILQSKQHKKQTKKLNLDDIF